jgi:glucose-6-phosphate-specific signal transduction histidine kinase
MLINGNQINEKGGNSMGIAIQVMLGIALGNALSKKLARIRKRLQKNMREARYCGETAIVVEGTVE